MWSFPMILWTELENKRTHLSGEKKGEIYFVGNVVNTNNFRTTVSRNVVYFNKFGTQLSYLMRE